MEVCLAVRQLEAIHSAVSVLNNNRSVALQWISTVQELPEWLHPDTIVVQCCSVNCDPLLLLQASLCCWLWPFTPEWRSTTTANAMAAGASPGHTSWAGWLWCWHSSQVRIFTQMDRLGKQIALHLTVVSSLSLSLSVSREGIFYMCAYRMHECPRNSNSRWLAIEVNTCSHISTGQRIVFQRN